MDASTPMTRDVTVVPPELPLELAHRIMQRELIRHLPVVRSGALLGILSDRDLLARGTLRADGTLHLPHDIVASAMTAAPVSAEADAPIAALVRLMTERKVDAIPIVRGLRLVGLVTSTDLLLLLVDLAASSSPLPFEFRLDERSVEVAS